MLIFALFYPSLIGSNKKMLQAGWLYIDICMASGDNNFHVLVVRASEQAVNNEQNFGTNFLTFEVFTYDATTFYLK